MRGGKDVRKDYTSKGLNIDLVVSEQRLLRFPKVVEGKEGEEEANEDPLEDRRRGWITLRQGRCASIVYRINPLFLQSPRVLLVWGEPLSSGCHRSAIKYQARTLLVISKVCGGQEVWR